MLTNRDLKLLRLLKQKKYRQENGLFLVEGKKSVIEVINSDLSVQSVFATEQFLALNPIEYKNITQITKLQSEQISSFSTAPEVYALVSIPNTEIFDSQLFDKILLLDGVRDAGNLGTIIRIADWFNIDAIVCSNDSVELYNPKTLQSSMGSFTRKKVFYSNLKEFIQSNNNYTYYGTFMTGKPLKEISFDNRVAIVLGSESHGISTELQSLLQHRIAIPLVNNCQKNTAESLNVAISAAICCYELNR